MAGQDAAGWQRTTSVMGEVRLPGRAEGLGYQTQRRRRAGLLLAFAHWAFGE